MSATADTNLLVVCPYVGAPHPRTREALQSFSLQNPCTVEYVDVSRIDTAYSELVCDLWRQGESFAIVEHDIVVRPDVLEAFVTDTAPFIAYPYAWTTNIGPALGCDRWSSDFLAAYPTAAEEAANVQGAYGRGHWREFDYWLIRLILEERYGQVPKLGLPPVEHLNDEKRIAPQFEHLTLGEQLAKVGYRLADDGLSAEWVGRPRRAVRPG